MKKPLSYLFILLGWIFLFTGGVFVFVKRTAVSLNEDNI